MDKAEFKIIAPPEPIRPFVRRYLYANERLSSPLTFHPKPTGYTYFSNCFGNSRGDHIAIDGRQFQRSERRYLLGQIADHAVTFRFRERLEMVICELKPTAHYRLFGLSGAGIVGVVLPLAEFAPQAEDDAKDCFRLGVDATCADHLAEANAFITCLAERARPEDAIVEAAIAMFEAADGAVSVAEIARRIGVSPREIHRRFVRIVGLNPKLFGRILQINWAVGLLYANDTKTLAHIAQEAGFHDQAHFNHTMQCFFREGPSAFLRGDHVGFKTFLGRIPPTAASLSRTRGRRGGSADF